MMTTRELRGFSLGLLVPIPVMCFFAGVVAALTYSWQPLVPAAVASIAMVALSLGVGQAALEDALRESR